VPLDPQTTNDLLAHVAKDSPAAQAGIRDGDVLLKIDQLDVTPWRTQPGFFHSTDFGPGFGDETSLTLRRGGKTIAIDVMLRNISGHRPNWSELGRRYVLSSGIECLNDRALTLAGGEATLMARLLLTGSRLL